jgi:Mor family transcriptional regulator
MYNNIQELRLNPSTCNAGKKWETEEDELLVKLVNENKSHQEIAIEFKRTEGSIRARIIDKILFPEYNNENITELAKKYNFNDVEYLERCIKVRIAKKENAIIAENIIENETKEEYEERMEKIKKEKLNKKIERNQIRKAGGEKYYELLLNIVERLERIEKKIDGYDFTE